MNTIRVVTLFTYWDKWTSMEETLESFIYSGWIERNVLRLEQQQNGLVTTGHRPWDQDWGREKMCWEQWINLKWVLKSDGVAKISDFSLFLEFFNSPTFPIFSRPNLWFCLNLIIYSYDYPDFCEITNFLNFPISWPSAIYFYRHLQHSESKFQRENKQCQPFLDSTPWLSWTEAITNKLRKNHKRTI